MFSNTFRGRPVFVTDYGFVVVSEETAVEIAKECPRWMLRQDRRTKEYKRLRAIERNIADLAAAMWLSGDNLTEI